MSNFQCPQHDLPVRADGSRFCTGEPGGCAWGHALPSATCIRAGSTEDRWGYVSLPAPACDISDELRDVADEVDATEGEETEVGRWLRVVADRLAGGAA